MTMRIIETQMLKVGVIAVEFYKHRIPIIIINQLEVITHNQAWQESMHSVNAAELLYNQVS